MKPQTTVQNEKNGVRITRTSDGESVLVVDIGRCYCIYKSEGYVNVSHNIGSFDHLIRIVRGWLRRDEIPIMDVHC